MTSPSELVSRTVTLVTLPAVYLQVARLMGDARSSMDDIAQVISQDPAITARVLRVVNSACLGLPIRIDTVSRASTVLGTQQLNDLILATSVANAFVGISANVIDVERFWRRSVYRGIAARLLATRCNVHDSERLLIGGLLCHIGHLVMYEKIPVLAEEAQLKAQADGIELFRVERELMGFDYAELGGELLAAWDLSPMLEEQVRHHPEPANAPHSPLTVAIVHIANLLADVTEADIPLDGWQLPVAPQAWQVTGLNLEALGPLKAEADGYAAQTYELFLPDRRQSA